MTVRQPLQRVTYGVCYALVASCLVAVLIGLCPTVAQGRPAAVTAARQTSSAIVGAKTFTLARGVTHVAVHWRGSSGARVRIAFSRDGRHFGRPRAVGLDELGEQIGRGETYGAVMPAGGARAIRVSSDRRLRRLSLLALSDHGAPRRRGSARAASTAQPTVIPRSGWGADETLRYDSTGKETWPPEFWPIQKLIVHHTDTQNNDPNPTATIRSIYYYHAITQGWGDIGYNFLVDEAGNVYEGRHARTYALGESPTGEDLSGYGVTGGHALNYNAGTMGVALLGTLTNQDATAAARDALERVLAWKASAHNLDPQGTSLYTNPVNGTQKTFANIAGHRDVNSTECPGGIFYATLPRIRSDVAALIAGTPPPPPPPTVVTGSATAITTSSATLAGTVNPNGQATSYHFDYGTTATYGRQTPPVAAGSASTAGSVSATLSGLARKTGYHYRLVASSANSTAVGADATFTTRTR
ncbi:MAG: N-acetylmuramoyl-L-alanine amidase [Actinomycetota bacterium]|nr:N-acetylmuramoyl-L-alanine amidase [Actinomycetota bacterium]